MDISACRVLSCDLRDLGGFQDFRTTIPGLCRYKLVTGPAPRTIFANGVYQWQTRCNRLCADTFATRCNGAWRTYGIIVSESQQFGASQKIADFPVLTPVRLPPGLCTSSCCRPNSRLRGNKGVFLCSTWRLPRTARIGRKLVPGRPAVVKVTGSHRGWRKSVSACQYDNWRPIRLLRLSRDVLDDYSRACSAKGLLWPNGHNQPLNCREVFAGSTQYTAVLANH